MGNEAGLHLAIGGQLISPHYLRTQLPKREDRHTAFDDSRASDIQKLYERVRPVLTTNKPQSKGSNEEAVRDLLLNPVFEILGLPWSPGVHHFGKQLDYALYVDRESFEKAQTLITEGNEIQALRTSCAVAEAERWGKEFGDKPKKSDLSDPIFQIEFYLGNARRSGGPRWGILTNGHVWRLYCGDSDPLRHDFLEIELPTRSSLFASEEQAAFQALVYFFSSEAIRRGGRLDRLYDDATRQAAAITAELRRQAFGAVELIASGIMRSNPTISPVLAYEASLIQLFRLLFILKAEADGLLSKRALTQDLAERIIKKNQDSIGGGSWEGKNFWHELHDIFEAIANEYNGHLFEGKPPTSSPAASDGVDYFAPARALLESVAIPNQFTANAIDRLLRVYQSHDGHISPVRVDYSTLRVRELGTIYEGLLEWKLEPVARKDIEAGSIKLLGERRIERIVVSGDYKLVADQADRKATGSYYTPHIVVEFIGQNTLLPLLKEIETECDDDPQLIIDKILAQRILDPAMGSGHFLVFAVEYLADYVSGQLGLLREAFQTAKKKPNKPKSLLIPLDASIEFIRARIAERCVFGVDVNPLAVELAKLSLWISTAGKHSPLSFLNHHLRCGDSLLGISSNEFHHDLFAYKLTQQMGVAVGFIRYINDSTSNTLKEVSEKEEHLKIAREHLRRFRLSFDAQLAPLFKVDVGEGVHAWLDAIAEPVPEALPAWLREVEKVASEYRFFHWELEFPEVWRDRFGHFLNGKDLFSKPGFDVILGNPPFVTAHGELARRAYIERWSTAIKGFHLLVPFFERAFGLLRPGGRLGFIVSNAFAKREFGKTLIEEFLPTVTISEIVDCSGLLFPGHGTPTLMLFGLSKVPTEGENVTVTAGLKGDLRTNPEDSPLWESIAKHHTCLDYEDEWITVTARPKEELAKHPWIFSGQARGLVERLSKLPGTTLESLCAEPIGAQFITGADDIYVLPWHLARRSGIPQEFIQQYSTGEDIRDWQVNPSAAIIFPYDNNLQPLEEPLGEEMAQCLYPYKEQLEKLIISGTTPKKDTRLKWFEYRRLARKKLKIELNVIVPQIAMYNHACVCDHSIAFKEKAQAIAFKGFVSNQAIHAVTAFLNSSAAGFWLKQVCFNKGPGTEGEHDRFEFSGNILGKYVIPTTIWENGPVQSYLADLSVACHIRAGLLRSLSARLLFSKPGEAYENWYRGIKGCVAAHPYISSPFESHNDLTRSKERAREERARLLRELMSLQEEIDWIVYAVSGLIPENDETLGIGLFDAGHPWEIDSGQRPFELALSHSGPLRQWERKHRNLWLARIKALEQNEDISRIETSIFKRRWVLADSEQEFREAFFAWLMEKAEFHLQHRAKGGPIPFDEWCSQLWQDQRIRSAVYAFRQTDTNLLEFSYLFKKAVDTQTVPEDFSKFRAAHKHIRGRFNVPRERFRSSGEKLDCYSWAGKQRS